MENDCSIPYPYDIQKTSQKKRYHKDVNYESSPMALNLFSIYQICDLACSSDYIVQKHRQICHEISYIVSGEGTFYRNEKAYAVCPNTIFLVNASDIHSITSAKNAPLRFMCLGFIFHKDHPDYPKYEHIDRFFDALQDPMAADKNNLFGLFSLAMNEVSSYDPLSGEMFESYVRQIIIQTYRNFTAIPSHHMDLADINDTNPLLYEITNYIDTNLTNIKHLTDISAVFDYSYGYLSRTFSQAMGITIKDYYTQRRLERAADLLAQGISVSQVSEQLQFADIPSFYKVFKRYYHVSPRKYQVMITEKPELEGNSSPKI